MKKIYRTTLFCALLALALSPQQTQAQSTTFGEQQIITTDASGAWSVYASDLDGDGDIDVLSASLSEGKIAWYENEGMGNFGAQQIITIDAGGAKSVYASDLDGDGDMDVLSASNNIAWYENDGMGNFGAQQIITTAVSNAVSVHASDLDGDGDMDVLSASQDDYKIAWYENDGMGNFGAQQIITTAANQAQFVYASDLDGDGDMDVLSTYFFNIAWYENDGMGNFGAQQIITTDPYQVQSIYASDLDGDGDIDVLSASVLDYKIAWYENDGTGNFGAQQIITTAAIYAWSVYASDLDGDGDIDVLSASSNDDKIAWYENGGMGNFGAQQIITTAASGARSVYASDLDGDGDIDVLSASTYDYKIAWYENLLNDPKISGAVFYDTNQNGVLDSGDFGMNNQTVSINPNTGYSYTSSSGLFAYYFDAAGTYTLNYAAPTGWTATTPSTLSVSVAVGEGSANNNFGIYPNTVMPNIKPYVSSAINRCNWVVPYYLSVINEGTTIEPLSVVSLQPDPQLTYVNASLTPDSIGAQGWLYWHVNNLLPAQQRQIVVQFQVPDFNAMGDTLASIGLVKSYNNAGVLTDNNSFSYRTAVLCSYDPNDKQVQPLGIGEQNYTLINDEEFIYTIRFQNTGNDTAFNIIVADTLSSLFNHSTFRPITSSHPMQVLRHQSGLVEFKFNNILLPDSTTNEAASHGFIMYAIKAQTPVPNNVSITNTAHIYFDFNPAIVTNTTQNLMVYTLPQAEVGTVVQLKVWLAGAYDSVDGIMHTDLYANGFLPTSQPFNTAPWNYAGDEAVSSLTAMLPNTVDWVLVELRSASNPSVIVAQRAVLLLNDGLLRDVTNIKGARFPQLTQAGSYYVVVRPRNHVALASANAIAYPDNSIYDLGNAANVMGGASQLTILRPNISASKAADANANGVVTVADYNSFVAQITQMNNYLSGDFDLNGNITVQDFNLYQSNTGAIAVPLVRY